MERDQINKKAFNKAFKAMQEWHAEVAELTDRRAEQVFDDLASAAKSAGWPDSMVDASKEQLLQASRAQMDMMQHMLDAWRSSLASGPHVFAPDTSTLVQPMASSSAELARLAAAMPQFWMEATAAWQRSWNNAMKLWMRAPEGGEDNRRERGNSRHR